jgi:hypothetical protein
MSSRTKYHCRDCRTQFRVTAGTLFHDSHLPLAKWFQAISLMLSAERGVPSSRLHEILGGSYKTAWFLEHRIRAAMDGGGGQLGTLVALAPSSRGPHSLTAHLAVAKTPSAALPTREPPAGLPQFKRLIAGPYRSTSTKHLSAYWNEARWRREHLDSPHAFRDTIVALLEHGHLGYARLVGHDDGAPRRGRRR